MRPGPTIQAEGGQSGPAGRRHGRSLRRRPLAIRATIARFALVGLSAAFMASCQTTESAFEGPDYSDETRQLERQLMAEATALGAAQGAAGIASSFDRSGVSSLVTMGAGRAARDAMLISAEKRLREQLAKDEAAFYRRHGISADEPD